MKREPQRKIIHVDMDAFFVSVEERDDPSLRGKPVAVGFDGPRGVVSTANYVARRFGVHSAMSIATAHRLCRDLIVVAPHFEKYKSVSDQIHAIFHDYTDLVEPLSLDEAYLDVTENKPHIALAVDIAREVKRRIRQTTGLTASAGVSYCKFLAKVASDMRKPDGLCTVHPDRALDFIAALEIERFWGVGKKTAGRFHAMGVHTGADLRAVPLERLLSVFGKTGRTYWEFARGIDPRPVTTSWVRKSLGCERTYLTDLSSLGAAVVEVNHLVDELVGRLSKHDFNGVTLTLKVKYNDFVQITRSVTVNEPLRAKPQLLPLAKTLLAEAEVGTRPVRLLGLTVSNPIHEQPADELPRELPLFSDEELY